MSAGGPEEDNYGGIFQFDSDEERSLDERSLLELEGKLSLEDSEPLLDEVQQEKGVVFKSEPISIQDAKVRQGSDNNRSTFTPPHLLTRKAEDDFPGSDYYHQWKKRSVDSLRREKDASQEQEEQSNSRELTEPNEVQEENSRKFKYSP